MDGLNVSALRKGSVIEAADLERITGAQVDTDTYRFRLLAVRDYIHSHTSYTVRVSCDTLVILTDAEASLHNHRRVRGHVRGIGRRHDRTLKVDAGQLTESQRTEHDKRIMSQSRLVSAITTASRTSTTPGYTRSTPGLLAS